MTLAEPLRPGVNAIGDVVLRAAPILVAGRVERMDGTPVERPRVEVQRTRRESSTFWQQAHELRAETRGEGRFVIRGLADESKRYRVRVLGDNAPHEPVEFEPGAQDLVLRVGAGGRVTARFNVDGSKTWQRLRYRLAPMVEAPDSRDSLSRFQREWREQGHPQPAGDDAAACTWTALAPGAYRLTVHCPGIAEPLADVPGIAVPAGGAAEDARLEGIDWRGRVRVFEVRVTDAAGAPVHAPRDAAVVIRGVEGDEAEWYGRALDAETGKVELVAVQPVDLLIAAPGFRSKDVTGVFQDTVVTLERMPEVRLRLPGGLSELPAGTEVRLTARVEGERRGRGPQVRVERGGGSWGTTVSNLLGSASGALEPGPGGDVVLPLPDDRVRTLRLMLYRRAGRKMLRENVDVTPAELDPASLRDGQVIELQCDPDALRAAMAKVAGG